MLLDMNKTNTTLSSDKSSVVKNVRVSTGVNENCDRVSTTGSLSLADKDKKSKATENDNEEEDGKLAESSSGSENTAIALKSEDEDDQNQHQIIENLKSKQSMSINKKFQRLFGGKITESNERLISVFRCALLRNNKHLLLQGMLYVTRKHFAFHSNILVYQTWEFEKWSDVKEIKKENIAIFFPTAISFTTHSGKKYFFASFLSRNQAFKILTKIWHHHSHLASDDESRSLNKPRAELETNAITNGHSEANEAETDSSFAEASESLIHDGLKPPESRTSSTSMSSMSSSFEPTELFMDSLQREDEVFPSEDESELNSSSLNEIGLESNNDREVDLYQPNSSFTARMTSSMANLAQSLAYFFILNRVNMFFFGKIVLFIQYLFWNRSYSSPDTESAESWREKNKSRKEALSGATFLSSRYIKVRTFRIYFSELLILVTFLVVVIILYVYIFIILLKVNAIETKLADLYEKLQSF